jgi:hypothetical protein
MASPINERIAKIKTDLNSISDMLKRARSNSSTHDPKTPSAVEEAHVNEPAAPTANKNRKAGANGNNKGPAAAAATNNKGTAAAANANNKGTAAAANANNKGPAAAANNKGANAKEPNLVDEGVVGPDFAKHIAQKIKTAIESLEPGKTAEVNMDFDQKRGKSRRRLTPVRDDLNGIPAGTPYKLYKPTEDGKFSQIDFTIAGAKHWYNETSTRVDKAFVLNPQPNNGKFIRLYLVGEIGDDSVSVKFASNRKAMQYGGFGELHLSTYEFGLVLEQAQQGGSPRNRRGTRKVSRY